MKGRPERLEDYLRRYPRICAHIIAESLGYATPLCAASILKDAKDGNENWCDWIYSCYNKDPRLAVRDAIRNRNYHKGYMVEYKLAYQIVRRQLNSDDEPLFASWF